MNPLYENFEVENVEMTDRRLHPESAQGSRCAASLETFDIPGGRA